MKLNIHYEPVSEKHIDAAVKLVLGAYDEEKAAVPFLPEDPYHEAMLKKAIENLFYHGEGIAAVHDDGLLGFLGGFMIKEFFGKCSGVYSPIYGHGAIKKHRRSIYQALYQQAADIWVKKNYMTHALTFFAHDRRTIETWFWQGFGMRCADAVRQTDTIPAPDIPGIIIRKIEKRDIPALAGIHALHIQYYRSSPIFMPIREKDPGQDLMDWFAHPNHHLWAAYQAEKPVGYMRIEPDGETFVSEHPNMMNITGAYVTETERESGIGRALLAVIQHWLNRNGYSLCGVDFESINTTGSRFWMKHFTPYTYSLVRRIDERVL